MNILIALHIVQLLLLLTAAWFDIATRMIPNQISLALIVAGITVQLIAASPLQFAASMIAAAVLFGILLFMHSRRWLGGGDVKLLVATMIGLPAIYLINLITATALAGGILALLHLVMRRLPHPQLSPLGSSFIRRVYAIERWRNLRHAPLPYGVAIASGGIWTILT
jgi:prepilin peptidase CpaA